MDSAGYRYKDGFSTKFSTQTTDFFIDDIKTLSILALELWYLYRSQIWCKALISPTNPSNQQYISLSNRINNIVKKLPTQCSTTGKFSKSVSFCSCLIVIVLTLVGIKYIAYIVDLYAYKSQSNQLQVCLINYRAGVW